MAHAGVHILSRIERVGHVQFTGGGWHELHDAYGADTRINDKYPTINHYKTTLAAKGVRLDYVMIKGSKQVLRYENVMKRVDSSRPSDHNLVVADVVL